MIWKAIFKTYPYQEVEEKEKQAVGNTSQLSQFPLFPGTEGVKKSNSISLKLDLEKLKMFLGKDWEDYKDNQEALVLLADMLFKKQLIEQGQVPSNFTAITCCSSCGYVYVPPALVNGGKVLGCPWCWNRVKGLLIPRIHTG